MHRCTWILLEFRDNTTTINVPLLKTMNLPESGSQPSVMHYSFDYSQIHFHFPFNAQPGPIFFKTPRKFSILGVSCEPTSIQVNYLINEANDVGKGANATVSLVHHFFAKPWPEREKSTTAC